MHPEWLTDYGIDYDKGLKNCMGSLPFYKKILAMFLEDPCFPQAKAAYLEGNQKELFGRMHELKGTSGNAALLSLYEATVPLVELLRVGNAAPSAVEPLFAATEAAYRLTCEGIAVVIAQA